MDHRLDAREVEFLFRHMEFNKKLRNGRKLLKLRGLFNNNLKEKSIRPTIHKLIQIYPTGHSYLEV